MDGGAGRTADPFITLSACSRAWRPPLFTPLSSHSPFMVSLRMADDPPSRRDVQPTDDIASPYCSL